MNCFAGFSYSDFQWRTVNFSDEKMFNVDGHGGLSLFWQNIRRDERVLFSRQMGGGLSMVWAAFSWYGKSAFAVLQGLQAAGMYYATLEQFLVQFVRTIYVIIISLNSSKTTLR